MGLILTAFVQNASAAPGSTPYTLNFSGYLASANGSPATGTYPMRFSLWLGTSPVRVWCAEYSAVDVFSGDFAVVLGSTAQGGTGLNTTCTATVPANLPINPALVAGVDSSTPVSVQVDISADGGTSWETLTPDLTISSAMFSLQSDNALTAESATGIQGVGVSATVPTLNQVLQYNGTNWPPATIAAGGGTPAGIQGYIQYNSAGSFGATMNLFWDATNNRLGIGNSTPATQIDVSGANANGTFRVFDQSAGGNTRAIIRSGSGQAANLTEWQNNAGTVQASMNSSGSLMTSALKLPSGTGSVTLQGAVGGSTGVTFSLPDSVGSPNQVLQTDGTTGNLTWATLGGGSGTVTSVTGTLPISVLTGTTTPAISITQANTTTNGYLSSTDWNTFNGKLSSSLASGDIFVGNGPGTATAVAMSGDATMANTGAVTVTGIAGKSISGSAGAGQSLEYNGTNWVPFTPVNGSLYVPLAGGTMTGQLDMNTATHADALAQILIATGADANKGEVIQAHSGTQSANLEEWQSSTGTVLSSISATGGLTVPSLKVTTGITAGEVLTSDASGNATWQAPAVNAAGITGVVGVANGGTALSATPANGQIPIGNGTNYTLAGLTGTANEVIVTNGAGTITLSTPQQIATASTPTFASETLNGGLTLVNGTASVKFAPPSSGSTAVTFTLPDSVGSPNQFLQTDGTTGNLIWATPAVGGGGTVTSVSATAPISVLTGTTTPAISITQANGTTDGYLAQADWTTFNGKLGTALPSGDIFVGNGPGTATAVAMSGDATMANTGALTVTGIGGKSISGSAGAGQALEYNGTNWVPFTPANGSLYVPLAGGTMTGQLDMNTATHADALAQILIATGADANKGEVIQAHSGTQSANLEEWQSSTGTALSSISATGGLSVPTLKVTTGASANDVLTSDASGNATWQPQAVNASAITGVVGIANGGTALSTTPTNGQLLVGNGTNYTLAGITATANQTTVTNGAGTITIGTAQNIATTSTPTFGSETLNGGLTLVNGTASVKFAPPASGSTAVIFTLPDSVGSPNQFLQTDGTTGALTWATSSGGSVTNVTATAPISVLTGTTTPAISITQANGTTDGYLAQADWTTFNGKLGTALPSGDIFVGNGPGTATAVAMSGDATMANTGALTVTGIGGKSISGTAGAGQALEYNGTNWVPFTPANGSLYVPLAGGTMTGPLDMHTAAHADALAQVLVATGADANKGVVVQANSGTQSANLEEWQSSTGTALSSISATGGLSVPTLKVTTGAAANDVLTSDASGNATWQAPAVNASSITGVVGIANGGTALSTTPTNGQLLVGNGTNYTLAGLTGTANEVVVTNAAGSITLSTPQQIAIGSTVQFGKESIATGSLGTNTIFGVNAPVIADNVATAMIASTAATNKPLVVQGFTGQSVDFQDWENAAGTPVYSLSSTGAPVASTDLTTKAYVGTAISGITGTMSGLTTNNIPYATSATTLGNTTMSWNSANSTLAVTGVATNNSLSLPTAATTNNISTLALGGTAITSNTGGALVGANTASAYSGDLVNLQNNSVSKFKVDGSGNVNFAGTLTGNGSGLTALPPQPYVVGGTIVGTFANSQILLQHPFPVNVTIPAGCTNSRFELATAATASTTISLQVCTGSGFTSCTQFGTATITAGNKVATFSCASLQAFSAGSSSLLMTGPATADATAGTAGWAIYGTR